MTEHWDPDWSLPSSLEACCPFSLSGILIESSRERENRGRWGSQGVDPSVRRSGGV